MFFGGGSLVKRNYHIPKILVEYDTEGTVPEGVDYLLVETEKGEAIFERSKDGSGALMETHWKDEEGDHYAGWVRTSHGYEYVIPVDRNQKGKKYVYVANTYSIIKIDGIDRPVPFDKNVEPVAFLIPK